MTPLLLGALAVLLAGPVPGLLARLPVVRRTPGAGLVLWQAVALSAVLAAVGAGLSLSADRAWREEPGWGGYVVAGLALALTLLVVARLLFSAHVVGRELRAIRQRHRQQVDLVGRRVSDGGVRVLEHELPVAYCLPGMAGSRIVMSSAALRTLDEHQLAAVLLHENAHLRARHDLVLEAFTVLRRAFPRAVSSRSALSEVALLVEALADRAAVRAGRARELGAALVALAEARHPVGTVGAAGAALLPRIQLLADRRTHRLQMTLVLLLAAAVVLLPTVLVVIPFLRDLG